MTLQEQFIQSKGSGIPIGTDVVVQMDRLPVGKARVHIRFLEPRMGCGVALKAAKGAIILSDGSKTHLLHVWSDPNLPSEQSHEVDCRDGELRIWNIYRVRHPGGGETVEQWTGNAGMIVDVKSPTKRLYRSSIGPGEFSPDFEFEVLWK